ncbi:MAG: DNA polymerase III subunit delta, partial [Desulfobacteraceae bacterium]
MARDLLPEEVLERLEKGRLEPFYLFYGPGEFRMERVLDRIRATYIPEAARDFNLEILYAEKKLDPEEIAGRARSLPFMASNRLIIVRRTEAFTAEKLAKLLPYLEEPTETTCLIFTAAKTNFNTLFYKKFRQTGRAVAFDELKGKQVGAWIRRMAEDMDLDLDREARDVLHEVVGNRLRDLHGELEKLRIR